ncbi:50S ribosomal protein L9 [bacterium]|nr:50S ribosomal protein L9 [bacterium]MBU1072718.1 50S ribosomal protein L9 [bacterium]MBU1676112.1 50S ribosomal protein L9 [bacterium]
MDVILTKKVDQLGEAGETVSVTRGYARNFLIPKGLAVIADSSHRRMLVEEARLEGLRSAKLKRAAEELATGFKDVSCTISVQASDDEKLYGSVAEREIAQSLADLGHRVDHKQIVLAEPIKQCGIYTVPVRLHEEVEVPIKVWVVKAES